MFVPVFFICLFAEVLPVVVVPAVGVVSVGRVVCVSGAVGVGKRNTHKN